MNRFYLPFLILLMVGGLFWVGLSLNPGLVPSPLIGKPAPAFDLPLLEDEEQRFTAEDLKGRVTMVHVWATWCVSCRAEHPVLMSFARRNLVPVIGFNYRDERDAAMNWLRTLGDPYERTLYDPSGRAGIDWGVYGTPETFIVDRDGIIRYKHVGPLSEEIIQSHLIPLLARLAEEGA